MKTMLNILKNYGAGSERFAHPFFKRFGVSLLIVLCMAIITYAHLCPNTTISIDTLFPGVTVQSKCDETWGYCSRDTFYQEELLKELREKFQSVQYVTLGHIESLTEEAFVDTVYLNRSTELLVPGYLQTLKVFLDEDIKGVRPINELELSQAWPNSPQDSITYLPALDTTFIVFYNEYGSIKNFGWSPTEDCLFEANIYFVINGRVEKRGLNGFPGVSVALEKITRESKSPDRDSIRLNVVAPQSKLCHEGIGEVCIYYDVMGRKTSSLRFLRESALILPGSLKL